MLKNLYHKNSNLIIKVIGLCCLFHGFYAITKRIIIWPSGFSEINYHIIALLLIGVSIIGSFLFIRDKKHIGWSIIVTKLAYIIFANFYLIPYYFQLAIEENIMEKDSLLGLVNLFDNFSPIHELRNALMEAGLLLIVLSILYNSVFISIFGIKKRLVFLPILAGILILSLEIVAKYFM